MIRSARTEAAEIGNTPIAAGELRKLFAGIIVEIEMAVAGALAGPQKAFVVGEKIQIVADVDPVFVGFGEDGFGRAGRGVGEKQVELILRAIEPLDGEAAACRRPTPVAADTLRC